MKDVAKILWITLLGFIIAVCVYPVTHEFGHSIMVLACGGKLKEISLLPLPSVLCDATGLSDFSLILIGISGIILPAITTIFIHPNKFYSCYAAIVFKGIVLLSLTISVLMIYLNYIGYRYATDDMVKALQYWKNGELPLCIILIGLACLIMLSIRVDHPIMKLKKEFRL